MSQPLVSAIVANWNGARDLEICLPSLLAQSYHPLEIIVADNASSDDSAAVAGRYDVVWHGLDRNKGLAGALNEGAKAAKGEFVIFLNNDMRFHEHFVAALVSEIVQDAQVFSVDALQYDWEGTKQIHLAAYLARHRGEGYADEFVPGLYVRQESSCDRPAIALSSCCAAMLARKSMFLELGGFDHRLPIGAEDLELCWRAWVRGWKTVFTPEAICWHRVGWSARSTEGAGIRFRGTIGGRLLIATKLLPLDFVIKTWLVSLAGLARDLVRFRWQRTRDRITVYREYAGNLFVLLRERREIFHAQHTSPRQQVERLLRMVPG